MTFEKYLKQEHNIHVCDDEFWNSFFRFNISSDKICELAEDWKLKEFKQIKLLILDDVPHQYQKRLLEVIK